MAASTSYRRVSTTDSGDGSEHSVTSASASTAAAAAAATASQPPPPTSTTTDGSSPTTSGVIPAAPGSNSHHHGSSDAQSRRSFTERLTEKIWAVAWVVVAGIVAYWSNFLHVVLDESTTANRRLLQLVAVCMGINVVLFLYLTVYLPYGKGLTDASAWEVYCPRVIPTATVVSVFAVLTFIRATWPVWGFLSPLILGVESLGILFATQFIPWPF